MLRRTGVAAVALGALAALALASSAMPAGGSSWRRVTDANLANINQLALARTPDGVLHLAWYRPSGSAQDLVHETLSANGATVGAAAPIVSGWSTLTNPSLLAAGGGLRALFSGIRSTSTSDPYSGGTLYTATAPASGSGWTLGPPAAPPSSAYASDVVGGAAAQDGSPVSSWSGTFGLFVHAGLAPSAPSTKVQSACCGYQAGLATDSASGQTVLAWYSNASGAGGILAATVLPSLGSTSYLPGSATADRNSAASPVQQVGIAARIGAPGVYVAYGVGYPTWKQIALWSHSTGKTLRVASVGAGLGLPDVAAAPSGRLWAMWSAGGRLYAVRSNRAVTRFGPVTALAPPPGSTSVWKLVGEGSLGPLDLFVSATAGGGIAFYHQRVLPPLTLTASLGAKGRVTFRVGDAGDAVPGAKVVVAGRTLTTGAGGSAATTLAPGAYRAAASIAGYRPAAASVRVPKKR
ncbi:MAG TPA: hypothetical protein VLN26_00860 [Gaiellaceae bacterium]|nr:hypothetical protein [Gaiellaceae bacterium]